MIGKLFAPLAMKLGAGLAALLALALLAQTIHAGRMHRQRDAARASTAAWVLAAAKATAWAKAEQRRATIYDDANQEKHDAQLAGRRAEARPVLDRYAAVHRCVRGEAAAGLGAGLPGARGAAQGADRTGGAPGLSIPQFVGVSERDLRVCADNTLRLETGVSWAAEYAAGPAPVGAGARRGGSEAPD